ncbi:MAG: VOC family protein [Candidatus Binataceae bacterium]
MVRTHGLTHINLNVTDVIRSMVFYQQVFGLEVAFRHGPDMVFLRTPGKQDIITLMKRERAQVGSLGISHFGFRLVDKADIDKAIGDAEKAGGKFLSRGEWAPGEPYAYIADPDGYVIEL